MQSQYENYPFWIIAVATLVSWSIYAIGIFVFAQWGIVWVLLYVAYCLWFEIKLLRGSCVNCYYYGKFCGFGKGRLCALLFRPGDPAKFHAKKITWLDIVPDFLIALFPLMGGIILLIMDFNWLITGLLVVLVVLITVGNSFVRGNLACKFCKQRDLGCPAIEMFAKTNKKAI